MKHKHVRKAVHYCCEMCDGPYAKYKKLNRKAIKQTEKRMAKKEINKDLADYKDEFGFY